MISRTPDAEGGQPNQRHSRGDHQPSSQAEEKEKKKLEAIEKAKKDKEETRSSTSTAGRSQGALRALNLTQVGGNGGRTRRKVPNLVRHPQRLQAGQAT